MTVIEGEFKPYKHLNKEELSKGVKLLKGTITFDRGSARFQLGNGNNEVWIRAGQDRVHIYKDLEEAVVGIHDDSIKISEPQVDGNPLSYTVGLAVLERRIAEGEMLEIERRGVYNLIVKNHRTQS